MLHVAKVLEDMTQKPELIPTINIIRYLRGKTKTSYVKEIPVEMSSRKSIKYLIIKTANSGLG